MLTDILTAMENHNSSFEQAVRTIPVHVCSVFKDGERRPSLEALIILVADQ